MCMNVYLCTCVYMCVEMCAYCLHICVVDVWCVWMCTCGMCVSIHVGMCVHVYMCALCRCTLCTSIRVCGCIHSLCECVYMWHVCACMCTCHVHMFAYICVCVCVQLMNLGDRCCQTTWTAGLKPQSPPQLLPRLEVPLCFWGWDLPWSLIQASEGHPPWSVVRVPGWGVSCRISQHSAPWLPKDGYSERSERSGGWWGTWGVSSPAQSSLPAKWTRFDLGQMEGRGQGESPLHPSQNVAVQQGLTLPEERSAPWMAPRLGTGGVVTTKPLGCPAWWVCLCLPGVLGHLVYSVLTMWFMVGALVALYHLNAGGAGILGQSSRVSHVYVSVPQ